MDTINVNRNVGNVGIDNQNQNVDAPKNEGGVIAKGIGLLKKAWLHLTGKAGNAHSQQLTNLRAQVQQNFGRDGLRNLENILNKKGWSADTSTKLFSKSELQNVMNKVEVRVEIDQSAEALKNKMLQDVGLIFDDPQLSEILDRFGQARYTQENIDFLRDMSTIPNTAQAKDIDVADLLRITDQYIGEQAEQYVNIDDARSRPILEAKQEISEAIRSGNFDAVAEGKEKLLAHLRDAGKEILSLTMNNMVTNEHGTAFDARIRDVAEQQYKDEVLMMRLEQSGLV